MSKKNNLKFKKRIKSELLAKVSQGQANPVSKSKPQLSKKQPAAPAAIRAEISSTSLPDNYTMIRRDLKKSAIIISSILIIIVAVYFIDNKTGFLLQASDHLFSFFHIGA